MGLYAAPVRHFPYGIRLPPLGCALLGRSRRINTSRRLAELVDWQSRRLHLHERKQFRRFRNRLFLYARALIQTGIRREHRCRQGGLRWQPRLYNAVAARPPPRRAEVNLCHHGEVLEKQRQSLPQEPKQKGRSGHSGLSLQVELGPVNRPYFTPSRSSSFGGNHLPTGGATGLTRNFDCVTSLVSIAPLFCLSSLSN